MKKLEICLFFLILLGAFVVRLYKFNNSLTDWHSWRQVDTSAVSRNFVVHGFDVLHPRFEDISNVPSGLDNPMGYRFVEFPLYNVLQAGGFVLFKTFSLEQWGRLITIFASLFSVLFIFLLAQNHIGKIGAFFSAGFFAFDPFNIYYSRTVLPDPSMVTATLASVFFFDLFISAKKENKWGIAWYALAIVFGAIALLLKPYAIFFFLPMLYLSYQKWGLKLFLQPLLWIAFILSAMPLALWRVWMMQYPAGIPASSWLFNGGNIRFTGSFFYWIFANRFARTILGIWGLPLFLFGILSRRKSYFFFLSFVAASLLYMIIIARGNVQHDYYQILIIPSIAFMIGLGADRLFHLPKEYGSKVAVLSIVLLCLVGGIGFGWYYVRNNYDTNPTLVEAGQAVDRLTPKDAKILTFRDGDTTFLYYTNRQGWASLEKSLPKMISMGADYIAIVNPTPNDLSGFGEEYAITAQTKDYLIINLHMPIEKRK